MRKSKPRQENNWQNSADAQPKTGAQLKPRQEKIVAAAIRQGDLTFSIPKPARHHHVLYRIDKINVTIETVTPDDQGFLTNLGRWVNRYEGWDIARIAGQLLDIAPTGVRGTLYSEDVW